VNVNGRTETGYIHRKHFTSIKTTPKDEVVVATKSPTNVRAGVSTKAKVLTRVKFGDVLNVKTFSKNWYEISIRINGKTETGYIHRKHVDKKAVKTTNYNISLSQALDIQSGKHARIQHVNTDMYVKRDALRKVDGKWVVRGTKWDVKSEPKDKAKTIGFLENGVTKALITVDEKNSTKDYYKFYKQFILATNSDIKKYLDPRNFSPGSVEFYQFLVLSQPAGTNAKDLNEKILCGKGTLEGQGEAFIKGAERHNINELYLISHAILETGHGTSDLAKGIKVGLNKEGEPELVTKGNENSLTKIKKTYNMFGIGAIDKNPNKYGAIRAYEEEWFSPAAAIEGGAKFIGKRYIHNQYKQDTLYKMRWNSANPGYPQYATDIAWAVKQVTQIKEMYNQLTEEDITKGYAIAGTGEIDFDGNVHRIGGIDKKIVAAHEQDIDIFFAPNENNRKESNFEVAKETAAQIDTAMKIVPVDTFEDAIH